MFDFIKLSKTYFSNFGVDTSFGFSMGCFLDGEREAHLQSNLINECHFNTTEKI